MLKTIGILILLAGLAAIVVDWFDLWPALQHWLHCRVGAPASAAPVRHLSFGFEADPRPARGRVVLWRCDDDLG